MAELLFAEQKCEQAYIEQKSYTQAVSHQHKQELQRSEQTAFEKLSNTITAKENEVLKLENTLKSNQLDDERLRSKLMLIIVLFFAFIISIVTFLLRKNQRLRKKYNVLATTDELTEIFNRRKIMSILSAQSSAFKKHNTPLYVTVFDLDLFKQINDTYGYNIVDDILKTVAKSVPSSIGEDNSIGC